MSRTQLSLKGLEVFQKVAKSGSVQQVAADTGLSVSTVSHHLRSLESYLGVGLMDHARRPMVLTPAGAIFIRHVESGLGMIRRGESELTSGNLSEVRDLRLGHMDDFENDVAPELVQFLAQAMPRCTFRHHTKPSHDIIRLLMDQKLDIGIATRPVDDVPNLIEYPLLRDPFVIAIATDSASTPEECIAGASAQPFIRYSRDQLIGKTIDAHLGRSRISLDSRFEVESSQSIISMVAEGSGWTITTPASFMRAKRFHGRVALHPFPGKGFQRTLSLFTSDIYPSHMSDMIAAVLKRLIMRHTVEPILSQASWLAPSFHLLGETQMAT